MEETIKGFMNFGLSGMLFYMWYVNAKKETVLQRVIEEQVEDKRIMREEREEFVRIISEQSKLIGRVTDIFERFEKKLRR